MTKKRTVVGLLLDMSGSMLSWKDKAVCGANEFIDEIARNNKTVVAITTFNSIGTCTIRNEKASKVNKLQYNEYNPGGMTPLYDAVARTILATEATGEKYKQRGEDVLHIVAIMTDGMENCSREYNNDTIRALIEKKRCDGWEIVFLGANIDATKEGTSMGVNAGSTKTFAMDNISNEVKSLGVTVSYAATQHETTGYTPGSFFNDNSTEGTDSKK